MREAEACRRNRKKARMVPVQKASKLRDREGTGEGMLRLGRRHFRRASVHLDRCQPTTASGTLSVEAK
jgi:hypothetical protein